MRLGPGKPAPRRHCVQRSDAAVQRLALAALLLAASPASAACNTKAYAGQNYVVCDYDARRDDVRLYLNDTGGHPYSDFSALARDLKAKGRELMFAMNGGMYEADLSPVGLYVEDGKRVHSADLRAGATNFHMKPNGVFWIGAGVAGVLETSRYLAHPPAARYATQSGPMLVVDGRVHPKILPDGDSHKMRNGVCVRGGTEILFAITEAPVNFHAFATLFKDGLGCNDALFLDGSISSLYAPELKRDDELAPLGPMIGVSAAPRSKD